MPDERSEEFDAADFVARLQRGVAEHAAVAAQRPNGDQLARALSEAAHHLYDWTESSRKRACRASDQDPALTYDWFPLSGSTAHSDSRSAEILVSQFCANRKLVSDHWLETNPTRNPTAWAIDFLVRCFHTVVDSLEGIAALTTDSETLRAPITLSRSVLEASAMGCYITLDGIGERERLRRILNLHFAQTKESSNERSATSERTPSRLNSRN